MDALNTNLPPQPSAPTREMISVGALFRESWEIFKSRFRTFVGIYLWGCLLMLGTVILPVGAAVGIFIGVGDVSLDTDAGFTTATGLMILAYLLILIAVLAVIYISIWMQTALLMAIKNRFEEIGYREAFRRARPLIGAYFWTNFVSCFIIIAGFFLFVIPGIVFSIWFAFSGMVVVSEGYKGMNAVLHSREYVRGHGNGVFYRFLAVGVLFMVVNIVLGLTDGNSNEPSPFFIAVQVITQIISALLGWFLVVYTFRMYENLKDLKAGQAINITSGQKTGFTILGILGFLMIPAMILGFIWVINQSDPNFWQNFIERLAN